MKMFATWMWAAVVVSAALLLFLPEAGVFAQTASNGFSLRTISSGGELGMRGRKALGPYDLDADGNGEFIVLAGDFTNGGAVKIYEATGNNTYTLRSTYSITESLWNIGRAIAFGDVDGDSQSEIVLGYYPRVNQTTPGTSVVRILEVSTTTFAISENANSPAPTPQADPLAAAVLGDTDGDTNPEFIIANDNSPELNVYEWNGSNGWTKIDSLNPPDDLRTMEVGDTDNDGKNEIVIAGDGVFAIYKFESGALASDGTIVTGVPANSNEIVDRIAIGDIDNNGTNEIVLGFHDDNGVQSGGILVYENTTGTNYDRDATSDTGIHSITANEPVYALAIGDHDNDNKSEIYWADEANDNASYIEFNNGGGAGDFGATRFDAAVSIFTPADAAADPTDILYITGSNKMLDVDLFRDIVVLCKADASQEEVQVIESSTQDNSLPVELTSFSASEEDGRVVLEWVTESETDNLGFVVERRILHEAGWRELADFRTHEALKGQGSTPSRTEYSYTDPHVQVGTTYEYRLADVSLSGEKTYSPIIQITVGAAAENLPETFALQAAYPNPFNPETSIAYFLGETAEVSLIVYNALGRPVRTLVANQRQAKGSYLLRWDATNDEGLAQPSGVYFAILRVGEMSQVRKLMLVK